MTSSSLAPSAGSGNDGDVSLCSGSQLGHSTPMSLPPVPCEPVAHKTPSKRSTLTALRSLVLAAAHVAATVLVLGLLAQGGRAMAQAVPVATAMQQEAQDLFRVTGASAVVADGAIVVNIDGREETYVPGIGWLSGLGLEPPTLVGADVLMPASLIDALGIAVPRLSAVRTSGDAQLRVVLDVPGIAPARLGGLGGTGVLEGGEPRTLRSAW